MNLIFDLDDTLYDLMGPFELVHKKLYADKTDADCTELFIKSRDYSDEIMEAEIKGDIPHEDCFYERIKRTYHDVGIEMNREDTEEFERLYRAYQKEISLSEGVEEFLDYCKAHNIFIAILTNGRPKSQYAKVIALDLHRWFDDDHIFISGGTDGAGWHTVWFNHRNRERLENCADVTVRSIEELSRFIKERS